MIVYLDGACIPEEEAFISAADRGFLFADGVFETALLYDGVFFRLDAHLGRLHASAALLGIAAPSADVLRDAAHELRDRNQLHTGSLRITLTRGPPGAERGTCLITLVPPDTAWAKRAHRGWHIITARTRRPSTNAIPAQLKALGRTYALLARREAQIAGVDDALLLSDTGMICEGPSWNIFWRTDRTLYTPDTDLGVLAGVTRTIFLEEAPRLGYEVQEGAWRRTALDHADEIFATMTSVGLARIRALDGRELPAETPAADALLAAYWDRLRRECASGE